MIRDKNKYLKKERDKLDYSALFLFKFATCYYFSCNVKDKKVKAYKTNLILIFLLLGISPWAFSASAEMSSKHLRLVKDLMNNNLAYSQDATTTNIIEWEEEIVDSLRQKERLQKYVSYETNGCICLFPSGQNIRSIKKADAMMDEARLMKYNIGISLSYQALGDIYLNAGMRPEAVEEYEKAMKTLQATPHAEKIQERIFIQLVPTLIKLKRMDEAKSILRAYERNLRKQMSQPFSSLCLPCILLPTQ